MCPLARFSEAHAGGCERHHLIRETSAPAENNIANEVDRYVNWQGRALGYEIGQLETR